MRKTRMKVTATNTKPKMVMMKVAKAVSDPW